MKLLLRLFAGMSALVLLAGAGIWFTRPAPAEGAATIRGWVRELDSAFVADEPRAGALPFRLPASGRSFATLQEALRRAETARPWSSRPAATSSAPW
jgi:hypothetical protein